MMIDAFEPQGITHLAVDSIFMMPQLDCWRPSRARHLVFYRDCLIHWGRVSPRWGGGRRALVRAREYRTGADTVAIEVPVGEMKRLPLGADNGRASPWSPRASTWGGRGRGVSADVTGGVVG